MKRIKLIFLFAFGIPLLGSCIVFLLGTIIVSTGGQNIDELLNVFWLIPFLIMFGVYFLFIPSIFLGIVASFLNFQNRIKNFIYLIVVTLFIGSVYYIAIESVPEDKAIMSFILFFISSCIIGYFVFLKNKNSQTNV